MSKWLAKVREQHGADISEANASLLYRPALSWDEHSAICRRGDLSAISRLLEEEDHPIEYEMLFVASFNMLVEADFVDEALTVGMLYLEEFRSGAKRFRSGSLPDSVVLKKMAILYEQMEYFDEAIAMCDCALRFGVTDGTKGGYAGRKARLEKKKA